MHADFVHDVSFDYYGMRMATCSSDQKVRVWDKASSGEWRLTDEWKVRKTEKFGKT
jgi:nucleoporin SEH1